MEADPALVNNMILFSVMYTDYSTPLITVANWYLLTLYIVYISFPSVHLQTTMNETGENMVSTSTCPLKYLHDIDIRASNIQIGGSYGQVFVRVNDIDIGAYDINIRAYHIDIGAP